VSETSLTMLKGNPPQGYPMWKLLLVAVVALPAASCADLNPTQQRALTGTAAGAGIGAVAGAIGGNAALGAGVGAGAGLLTGLVVDRQRRAEDLAFQQGVAAGRQGAPTSSTQ
jgi:hypothetical protein